MLARFLTIKLLSWSVPADLHGIDAYAHIFAYNELSWGLAYCPVIYLLRKLTSSSSGHVTLLTYRFRDTRGQMARI